MKHFTPRIELDLDWKFAERMPFPIKCCKIEEPFSYKQPDGKVIEAPKGSYLIQNSDRELSHIEEERFIKSGYVIEKSDDEATMEFLRNPKNREGAVILSLELKQMFPNSFTIKEASEKLNQPAEELRKRLVILKYYGLCQERVPKDSVRNGKVKYKIHADPKDMLVVINRQVRAVQNELNRLLEEQKKLEELNTLLDSEKQAAG